MIGLTALLVVHRRLRLSFAALEQLSILFHSRHGLVVALLLCQGRCVIVIIVDCEYICRLVYLPFICVLLALSSI